MYDLIGDIRGFAFELKVLAIKIDYRQGTGTCASGEHKSKFLGD